MKVKYRELIRSYRGKHDGLVYYYHPGLERCLARSYVVPKATENNRKLAAVARKIRDLEPSSGYRDDLKVYLQLLKRQPDRGRQLYVNLWSLFTRLIWAQCRSAGLDPELVTREQIVELPCRTVKTAVEAGLLAEVPGYALLTRLI